jgi:hypothetical protein
MKFGQYLSVYINRRPYVWLGFEYKRDYYQRDFHLTVFKVELYVSCIRKWADEDIKSKGWAWNFYS